MPKSRSNDQPPRTRSRLIENIIALSVLQASSYVLPLAMAAVTTRALGAEVWGRLALVQVVLGYFSLVISWGFSWSATRKIAAIQNDRAAVSRVAMATMGAQMTLAAGMAVLLLLLVKFTPFFGRDSLFYLWGLTILAGNAVFPSWLLTGLERMRVFSTIQILLRVATLVVVFLVVHRPEDAPLMIAIQGGTSMLAGLISIWWLKISALIEWHRPSFANIFAELRDGAAIFTSTTAISLYVNFTPIVLGTLLGPVATGQFVLADRLRQSGQSVLAPVSNALFPRISHLVAEAPDSANHILRLSAAVIISVSLMISVAFYFGADQIVRLIGGPNFGEAAHLLRMMSVLPVIMSFSTFLGLQVLLPNRRTQVFNAILITASGISLILIVPMVRWLGPEGGVLTLCLVEGFVSSAMVTYVTLTGYFSGRWHRRAVAAD